MQMDETRFLLGKQRIPYFESLVRNSLEGKIPFYGISSGIENKTVINYLWFGCVQSESNITCRLGYLYKLNEAFGIKRF